MQIHVGKVLNHPLVDCCSICTKTVSEYIECRRCCFVSFKIRRFILAKVFIRYVKEINFLSWLISNVIFPEISFDLCIRPWCLLLNELQTRLSNYFGNRFLRFSWRWLCLLRTIAVGCLLCVYLFCSFFFRLFALRWNMFFWRILLVLTLLVFFSSLCLMII